MCCYTEVVIKRDNFVHADRALLYRGQALLIVLLSMAVVLTIVLSILSRSITDVTLTTREEEALRAFSAAEAGVEQALIAGAPEGEFGGAQFSADVSSIAQGSQTFVYPIDLPAGDIATVWFVSHDADGNLVCSGDLPCFTGNTMKVCWGKPDGASDQDTTPAIEASLYYATTPGDYTTVRIARAVADPNSARRSTNSFGSADLGCGVEGENYAFATTISFADLGIPLSGGSSVENELQMVRIRMIYNSDQSQPVGFDFNFAGNSPLPSQGRRVDSTGTSGDSTRRVEVYRLFSDLPPNFDSALFSPSGLAK